MQVHTGLVVTAPDIAGQMPGCDVHLRIWRIDVGRVALYLPDSNIPRNDSADRPIAARLNGCDHEMRIRQEMVVGKKPADWQMNAGHTAF
jgi:glycogen phosphorylase